MTHWLALYVCFSTYMGHRGIAALRMVKAFWRSALGQLLCSREICGLHLCKLLHPLIGLLDRTWRHQLEVVHECLGKHFFRFRPAREHFLNYVDLDHWAAKLDLEIVWQNEQYVLLSHFQIPEPSQFLAENF